MTNPVYLNPVLQNADAILEKCVEIYQTLSIQQQVNSRFVEEEVTWLTTTNMVAHITLGSGQQVELPSWSYVSSIATASTQLTQSLQQELVTIFTSTNPTVTIDDGFGNQIQIPSYNALGVRSDTALTNANTAYALAGTANTAAQNALILSTAANTLAQVGVNNSNPPNYQTLVELNQITDRPPNSIAYVVNDPVSGNNTNYQWDTSTSTWSPFYDRLKMALGDARGYLAQGVTGAVVRSVNSKLSTFTSPEDGGAVGDGVDDAGPGFRNSYGDPKRVLFLASNAVYRIRSNTRVGVIVANGAQIHIDSGVTFTYESVIGADRAVFYGPGVAKSSSNKYDITHYHGATFDEKFNLVKQAFVSSERKHLVIPTPRSDDPAVSTASALLGYKVTAPLYFDSACSNLTVFNEGALIAVAPTMPPSDTVQDLTQTGMLVFENVTKVDFVLPQLELYCASVARHGIEVRGGLSGFTAGTVYVDRPTQHGMNITNYNAQPSTNIRMAELSVDGFGLSALHVELIDQSLTVSAPLTNCKIDVLRTTGASSSAGQGIAYLAGNIDGLTIDSVIEDISASLFDWQLDTISITNTVAGTPNGAGIYIGKLILPKTVRPALACFDTSGLTQPKPTFGIGTIDQSYQDLVPVNLQYATRCTVGRINIGTPSAAQPVLAVVQDSCDHITFNGVSARAVRTTAPYTWFNGTAHLSLSVPNSQAIQAPIQEIGSYKITLIDYNNELSLLGFGNNYGVTPISFSPDVNVTTGALTGMTGPDGKLNVSVSQGVIYIENRMPNAADVVVSLQ